MVWVTSGAGRSILNPRDEVVHVRSQSKLVDKQGMLDEIKQQAAALVPQVCEPDHGLVWADGPPDAKIALVGEAPGDKEEKLGRPFVGPAGKLLDRELAGVGLDRDDIWVTNVVKCRPTREMGGRMINRAPTAGEVRAWEQLLVEELQTVSPRIIICAGALAAKTLIRRDFALTKERGIWFDGPFGTQAIATFHPAYILRQINEDWDRAIEAFRLDLAQVAEAARTLA